MILKHRDTEVLRFDWGEPFGVKNVEVNASAERFLPLAFRERTRQDPDALRYGLEEWLLHRTPPTSRRGIRDMLRHLGFRTDDPSWKRNLVTFSRGLSLNDVHWVVADDSKETWASSNLYGNPFSTAVASMAFTELGKFEFKPHPLFVMPDERLEVSQYFLQNRIDKILRYREKADKYLNVRRKNDTINPTISDKLLKKAQEAEDLRNELKATLKSFPRARTEKLAILFKTTTRTIARHLKALQDAGELKRIGSRKTGHWQVIDNPNHKEE